MPTDCASHAITYLRLSITDRCDLRCRYCAPYRRSLSPVRNPLSVEEIGALVHAFAANGVRKVRITGGEPLLRPDTLRIVETVAGTPGIETVGLTTNAVHLADMAEPLARAGLRGVNISLDSLNTETFHRITGEDCLAGALRGLDAALNVFDTVKINTVVMRGMNDSEIPVIADLARRLPVDVRFIELMPLGHTAEVWESLFVSAAEIRGKLGNIEPMPRAAGSSADLFAFAGGKGRVGTIAPISESFCAECNRVRVTAAGMLKPCLRLADERDIRPLLGKDDLTERLGALMQWAGGRKLRASDQPAPVQAEAMCSVGG